MIHFQNDRKQAPCCWLCVAEEEAQLLISAARTYAEGDLFEPLPATLLSRVDVLIANVPYVPTDSIRLLPPEARIYEASVALHGGEGGLDVMRRVAGGLHAG
ncbi:hypothetical protein EDM59_18065 [Brevibacillus nitrificans]|uniref:Uncharacterized protein n=1 Tax=Brevibacillus nitrificans TaxID=651560 RepID=A0A3M8D4D5_9BACL|nr:hypothetical protein [Brevibacillus nitrificans]RNB82956.1 hypothetical protein EDM59_18065 [Brevibacillus nitrificans]